MAMSRIASQTLTRASLLRPLITHHHRRHRSTKSDGAAQLVEVDLDSPHPDSPPDVIAVGVTKLEEAIHSIIVRRAAPDWLPFLPGYSYWVPPRAASIGGHSAATSMIEVIGKLAARGRRSQEEVSLSEDEQMALTSAKGWPSSDFFIQGTSPGHPVPYIEVEVKTQDSEDSADDTSSSEDEEG